MIHFPINEEDVHVAENAKASKIPGLINGVINMLGRRVYKLILNPNT